MELRDGVSAYSRQVPWDRSLRCSDRDREAVGDILRKAHVAGRLDADEFAERFGRALEARTYADLDALLSDLPVEAEVPPPTSRFFQPSGAAGPAWPAPGWGTSAQPPLGPPPGQCGPPAPRWHLWPSGAFLLMWLAMALAVFAATSGHVFWLFIPLAWFFWARGGKCGRRRRFW